METDDDLPTLIAKQEHGNVLKYIRVHKLREPELVVQHGMKILGWKNVGERVTGGAKNLAVVEQVCLAALDCQMFELAERCFRELEIDLGIPTAAPSKSKETSAEASSVAGKESSSVRFQLLRGRYYEAQGDMERAKETYDAVLQQNPACNLAWKRQYALHKSMPNQEAERIQCLNDYIQQHAFNDCTAWYELYQQYKEMGHWVNAIYCLQHVLITTTAVRAADTVNLANLHCELAECHLSASSTDGTPETSSNQLETVSMARKHMASALELNPLCMRAKFGLVMAANRYLLLVSASELTRKATKDPSFDIAAANEDFERKVSKELVKYGAEQILASMEDSVESDMQVALRTFLAEYTVDLE